MNLRLALGPLLVSIAFYATAPALAQGDEEIILRVGRIRSFVQTNLNTAWPDAQSPYCFSTLVKPIGGSTIIVSATIKPPAQAPTNIPPLSGFPGIYGLLDCGNVEQDIDADYPPGAYEFVVEHNYLGFLPDTFRSPIRLESNQYPSTPVFLGIDPSRPVCALCDLPLSWAPIVGASGADGMLLQIFHTTNFLTGEGEVVFTNSISPVVIPANTLLPNQRYDALLTFEHVFASRFDVIDVAELGIFDLYVLTESTYTKITRMPFRTTSGPCLTVISPPGTTPFRFRLPTIVGQSYHIQVSSNLVNWATTSTTNAATTQVIYEEPWPPATGQKFFRTISP